MDSTLTLFVEFQAACLLTLVLTFAFWFRFRETPSGDMTCIVVGTACAAALLLSAQMFKAAGCLGGIFQVPGLIVYLWFAGLWGSRRSQVQIRQWGRRHGYRIVTIEQQYNTRGAYSSGPDYRILARRLSDGQVLVGEVYLGAPGFRVHWIPVPAKHLPHGHPGGAGPEVPNPPHADPPPPSKQ